MQKLAVDVTFTQMIDKKGINNQEERAVESMYREYTQLEYMKEMGELDPDRITISHKKGALRAIYIIKEKRSGKVKRRTCADGRPQRFYIIK